MRPAETQDGPKALQGLYQALDENDPFQQVALSILKKMGLRADAVANGAEAIIALETLPYDLVLMDVQMPDMDGVRFAEASDDKK